MTYLVAAAERRNIASVQKSMPELWRQVRRYNRPVQLALAAAAEVVTAATDAATAALISLAPCQPGSSDLYGWGPVAAAGIARGSLADVRLNPTLTLHAVDNLAMSAFAIFHKNHGYCLGLGGAAGQAWCAFEAVQERLTAGCETEAVLMAGDQESVKDADGASLGVALLFSTRPKPYPPIGRPLRLIAIERRRTPHAAPVVPHAAEGISAFLFAVSKHNSGRLEYAVPPHHSDAIDDVTVVVEAL
jgi:hypothetical protein